MDLENTNTFIYKIFSQICFVHYLPKILKYITYIIELIYNVWSTVNMKRLTCQIHFR